MTNCVRDRIPHAYRNGLAKEIMLELVENVQLFQESHGDQIRKHSNCSSLCNRIQIWRDLSFHSLQK